MTLFGRSFAETIRGLGFRATERRAMLFTLALTGALLAVLPVFSAATGMPIALAANWQWLAFGIFLQAGIAEEALFRGFLFRHFREGRTFWNAAFLSALPFASVHLLIFASMDFAVALAALLVSVSLSFPFAWLFERSGNSVWAVALLHAVVQGAIKLVVVPEGSFQTLAIIWMVASASLPWLVFLLKNRDRAGQPAV